jgi:hypothetical protein
MAAREHAEAYRWSRCTAPMSALAERLAARA